MKVENLEGYVQSLSIALMNGLWQGGILVLVYIGVARWVPWMSASARHNLGMMTLIAMVWIHCAHIIHPLLDSATDSMAVEVTEAMVPLWQAEYLIAKPGAFLLGTEAMDPPESSDVYPSGFADPALTEVTDGRGYSEVTARTIPHRSLISQWWVSRIAELKSMSRHIQWNMRIPFVVHLVIVLCVIVLAFYRSLLFFLQLRHVLRIKKSAQSADAAVESLFQSLLSDHPRRRSVSLGVSAQVSSPLVIGFRSPKILLPPALNDEATGIPAMRCILHHELAHIERWDDWANLFQQCLVSLMYFNPILIWLSNRLTIEREMACDERALKKVLSPQEYALVLTEFAMKSNSQPNLAAPAAWNKKSQLKERITMIINERITTSPWLSRVSALSISMVSLTLAGLVFAAGPRLTLAEDVVAENVASNSPDLPEQIQSFDPLGTGKKSDLINGFIDMFKQSKHHSTPGYPVTTPGGFASANSENQFSDTEELEFHGLAEIEHELAQKKAKLAGLLTRYSKKHPSVIQLSAEIKSLQNSINQFHAHQEMKMKKMDTAGRTLTAGGFDITWPETPKASSGYTPWATAPVQLSEQPGSMTPPPPPAAPGIMTSSGQESIEERLQRLESMIARLTQPASPFPMNDDANSIHISTQLEPIDLDVTTGISIEDPLRDVDSKEQIYSTTAPKSPGSKKEKSKIRFLPNSATIETETIQEFIQDHVVDEIEKARHEIEMAARKMKNENPNINIEKLSRLIGHREVLEAQKNALDSQIQHLKAQIEALHSESHALESMIEKLR